ncbi:DNRLRE domain-containing protein (plasmid) [Bacillus carboniphilus]|uniref:DNRLRE domain-containing protein n=1 Tax=Bacillus carboniphilus TaxID=86663 RepID=A0ABY9K187_9BACI|nr:DNRLRE domain-containing protein [Bacillus carboniphilus]WLR44460.1 DNRLRE domain-containing protein [Bacillus carboniphilus]
MKNQQIKKFIATLLTILLVFSSIPMNGLAESLQKNNKTETLESDQTTLVDEVDIEDMEMIEPVDESLFEGLEAGDEIIDMRTETSKFFYNEDGTITEEVYFDPIHKKEEGDDTFEEVSTKLVENTSDENKVETENAILQSSFLKKMRNGEYATFEYDGYTLTYSLLEAKGEDEEALQATDVEAIFEENQIMHKSVFPSIDLQNTTYGEHTKEYLILNEYQGYHLFQFKVETDLKAELTKFGEIEFSNQEEDVIFHIPKPFMRDSKYDDRKGEYTESQDVQFEIKETDGGYLIELKADPNWLEDPERQYPVYIDPSVSNDKPHMGMIEDSYVMSAYKNANYRNDEVLKVGYVDGETGTCYGYIKPNTKNLENYLVQKAELKVYVIHHWYHNNPNVLYLDRVNESWNERDLSWNEKPSSTTRLASVNVTRNQWANFDVTSTVKEWHKGIRSNYGFRFSTKGSQGYWKKIVSSQGSSNLAPRIEITHTPLGTAKAPKVTAYSSGKNTGTGYFNLSWDKIAGATHYQVAIYNGKDYEYFDVGTSTSWSTKGKGIWPTPSELSKGSYKLHKDGKGAELPNDPDDTYITSGGYYKDKEKHNYWFRIIGYNKEYNRATSLYSAPAATPTLPDSTRPNQPDIPSISISNRVGPNKNQAEANVKWNAVKDLPSGISSGINHYELEKNVNGSWKWVANVKHTGGSSYSHTVTGLPGESSIAMRIRAIDKKGNSTAFSYSSTEKTGDLTRPSTPTSVTVNPSSWSNKEEYTVSWSGIKDTGSLENIQYRLNNGINDKPVDDDQWKDLGVNSSSGSKKIPEQLPDGIHTIQIRGVDRASNKGYSNSAKIYKDTSSPVVSFKYPKENETLKGIEDVLINIENSLPNSIDTNMVHNGDFTDGLDGWKDIKYLDNGTISVEGGYTSSWNTETNETTVNETLSLKVDPMSTSSNWGYIASTNEIEVKPNTTYRLSGDIKTQLQNSHAFLNIKVMRSDGSTISWHDTRNKKMIGNQDWKKHNLTFTTDEYAEKVLLYLEVEHTNLNAYGTAWFDSIELVEINEENMGQYNWTLEYGLGTEPTYFRKLKEGTSSSNEIKYSWVTSNLLDQRNYTLRFTAIDEAGNVTTENVKVVKTEDTTSIKPHIDIYEPKKDQLITKPIQELKSALTINSFSDSGFPMSSWNDGNTYIEDLYVNSNIVSQEITASQGLFLDMLLFCCNLKKEAKIIYTLEVSILENTTTVRIPIKRK